MDRSKKCIVINGQNNSYLMLSLFMSFEYLSSYATNYEDFLKLFNT